MLKYLRIGILTPSYGGGGGGGGGSAVDVMVHADTITTEVEGMDDFFMAYRPT